MTYKGFTISTNPFVKGQYYVAILQDGYSPKYLHNDLIVKHKAQESRGRGAWVRDIKEGKDLIDRYLKRHNIKQDVTVEYLIKRGLLS